MRTVHKYVLTEPSQEVMLRSGCRFLHVDNQNENITLWVEVDTERPPRKRWVHVVGTGQEIPAPFAEHVGSALMARGMFVFHVYAEPEGAVIDKDPQ